MSNELAKNHERIWLEPLCCVHERCWSSSGEDCEDCGLPAIEYIRADLASPRMPGRELAFALFASQFNSDDPEVLTAARQDYFAGSFDAIREDYIRQAAKVLAILALSPAREEWQPIETAPKDGTPILIWQPGPHSFGNREKDREYDANGNFTGVVREYDDKRWAIGYWRPWGGWGNRNSADVHPTHWRPLPAPPVNASGMDQNGGGA